MQTLTLIRGLPGSGKTTFARELTDSPIEADQFFELAGNGYEFDPSKLADAHQWAQSQTSSRLTRGKNVVVANTFSARWELQPYIELAIQFAVRLFIVDLFDSGMKNGLLAKRNCHQVPERTIAAMRDRWEHDWKNGNPLPPWERTE